MLRIAVRVVKAIVANITSEEIRWLSACTTRWHVGCDAFELVKAYTEGHLEKENKYQHTKFIYSVYLTAEIQFLLILLRVCMYMCVHFVRACASVGA
jgi:hypothetical protein